MKRLILVVSAIVLTLAVAIGGTVAYLQDSDSDVNVMTVGNVYIEQIEQERDVNGNFVEFSQAKPAFPAVGEVAWADELIEINGTECKVFSSNLKNVVDKFVTVKNTGTTSAFLRTVVAIEAPGFDAEDYIHISFNSTDYIQSSPITTTIDGVDYVMFTYTYQNILASKETSAPSLMQVFIDSQATNEYCDAFGNTWDILVVSQAVQTAGFDGATEALDTAFGPITSSTHPWVDGVEIPEVVVENDMAYITSGDVGTVNSNGGTTVERGVFSDGNSSVKEIKVGEGITTLANRSLCKLPSLEAVTLPSTLTTIEEGAMQQSGMKVVEIPENVTYMGKTALGACANLETIIIKAKNITVANYVARDCGALKEVYIYSDTITFESGSMYFTNKQTGDASAITFYVANQEVADALYNSSSASRSFGMLIKSLDGTLTYYNTLR